MEALLIHSGRLDRDVFGGHVEQGQRSRLVRRRIHDDPVGSGRPGAHPIRPLLGVAPARGGGIGALDRLEHVHFRPVQRDDHGQLGPQPLHGLADRRQVVQVRDPQPTPSRLPRNARDHAAT